MPVITAMTASMLVYRNIITPPDNEDNPKLWYRRSMHLRPAAVGCAELLSEQGKQNPPISIGGFVQLLY
jgi:hypothetical protein